MTQAPSSERRFPRTARLLAGAEFSACFEAGLSLSTRYFRARYRWATAARLGLAVSRKVDRRAVVRNRIKRAARDSFRLARHELPAIDVVLLARHEAALATPDALQRDLVALWRRLSALKAPGPEGTMRADPATAATAAVDSPPPAPAVAPPPGASRPTPE